MTDEEFADLEHEILMRIREIRERHTVPTPSARDLKVTGIEATTWTDEDDGGDFRS